MTKSRRNMPIWLKHRHDASKVAINGGDRGEVFAGHLLCTSHIQSLIVWMRQHGIFEVLHFVPVFITHGQIGGVRFAEVKAGRKGLLRAVSLEPFHRFIRNDIHDESFVDSRDDQTSVSHWLKVIHAGGDYFLTFCLLRFAFLSTSLFHSTMLAMSLAESGPAVLRPRSMSALSRSSNWLTISGLES